MNAEPVILHGSDAAYEPGKGGSGFELFRSLQSHKDKIAQYIIETGESCTHGDLLEKSKKSAIYLQSKNLKKDDVVCLCSHNQMSSILPFFAAKFVDIGYSSIEPSMAEEDLIYLFKYIEPKVLFVAENVVDKIEECLTKADIQAEVIILGTSRKYSSLDKIISQTPDDDFSPVIVEDLKETAIIFFSSGTTGKPKGICVNHYSLLAKSVYAAEYIADVGSINVSNYTLNSGKDDYYNSLTYSPMYWISGITLITISTSHGKIRTMGATFNSESLWEAIHKFKPTLVFLPPGQVVDIYLKWKEHKYQANDDLKVFITGGGPVKAYHLEYLDQMFPRSSTIQMFGMTETSGLTTSFKICDPKSLELQRKYPESCGQIFYGTSMKICDVDTDQPCGYNQQGEVRVKTKYLMNGYYKMDSTSCFDQDGWFKTGDLAYFNNDNCLVIIDRLKDLLLYTLYNIRPSVIEEILAQHPSVHECFVIGIPHPKDNEHPMGVVKLKNDYNGQVTPDEILEFVNGKVPSDRYKIRAGVKFVNDIIKTPTGKIRKIAMKRMIIDGQI